MTPSRLPDSLPHELLGDQHYGLFFSGPRSVVVRRLPKAWVVVLEVFWTSNGPMVLGFSVRAKTEMFMGLHREEFK